MNFFLSLLQSCQSPTICEKMRCSRTVPTADGGGGLTITLSGFSFDLFGGLKYNYHIGYVPFEKTDCQKFTHESERK